MKARLSITIIQKFESQIDFIEIEILQNEQMYIRIRAGHNIVNPLIVDQRS